MPSRTEANGTNRLLHFLDLNDYGLDEVAPEQHAQVKREVADFLKNQALREISAGQSPVKGEGRFRVLNQDYARREKGGRRTADLELEGDLKDSLISVPSTGSFIKFGHEGSQVPKSDGHNQISTKAKAWARQSGHPKRRYIPDDGQKFDRSIERGIEEIIDEFIFIAPAEVDEFNDFDDDEFFGGATISSTTETPDEIGVGTSSLFSDDVIEELLNESFARRGIR